MSPTPAETAAAIGRLLDEWAADETHSQHMRWMLRRVSGVLAQTDWEDASAVVAASNTRLRSTIEIGSGWINDLDPVAAEHYAPAHAALHAALAAGSDASGQQDSLQARNDLNAMLRGAVDTFVSALESDLSLDDNQTRRRRGYACLVESFDDL